jgi:hypothetical protein
MAEISVYRIHPIIEETRMGMTEYEREQVERVVRTDGADIAAQLRCTNEQAITTARCKAEDQREDLEALERRVAEAEADEKLAKGGSLSKALTYRAAGLVCIGAEFAMTWRTVPWALDIPQYSTLGVCVAAAPTMALVLLKEALDRLVRPAYRAMLAPQRTWQAWGVAGLEILFLVGVIVAGAVAMLVHIADVRELAIRIGQLIGSGESAELTIADKALLASTVLVVTLYVSAVGATAFAYANVYGWAARIGRQARAALKRLRPERDAKREAARLARAEYEAAKVSTRYAPTRARLADEKYVATELAHLERNGRKPVEQPPKSEEPAPTFESIDKGIAARILGRFAHTNGVNGHAA